MLAGLLVVFLPMARYRLVDGDEGYYLLAAKLVLEGHRLYADFFFPQMPLVPYAYAAGMATTGISWISGRLLTGIFAAFLGAALFLHVEWAAGSRRLGLLAALLFATSSLGLGWYSVVKTYALTALLLFLAFMAFERGRHASRPGLYGLSGLLAALAIDARLLAVASLGAFAWALYRMPLSTGTRSRAAAWFAAGLFLGFLPVVWLAAQALPAFWFDNVGNHLGRSDMGLLASWAQKARVGLQLLGLPTVEAGTNLQVALLLAVPLGARYASGRIPEWGRLALTLSLWLGAVSFLPSPTYLQYFSLIVPFLVVAATVSLPVVASWLREALGATRPRALSLVTWLAVLAYLAPVPVDAVRYGWSGLDVPGIWGRQRAERWTVAEVRRVTRTIDRYALPGQPILSWWPGYLVESHGRVVPGYENHFGVALAGQLTPPERARYRLPSAQDMQVLVRNRDVPVVVSGLSDFLFWGERDLIAAGYGRVVPVGDAEVFVATPR